MEGLKQQMVEVEKQRDEHNTTIGKLRQVTASVFINRCGTRKDVKQRKHQFVCRNVGLLHLQSEEEVLQQPERLNR